MDFGLTDDQRDIQRTARDLLAERAKPERVREHAEAGTTDDALWAELCELGWPGIAVAEENGGQGLGRIELSILCEELGRVARPRSLPADGARGGAHRTRRHPPPSASAGCPGSPPARSPALSAAPATVSPSSSSARRAPT